jgi:hypothetical protein
MSNLYLRKTTLLVGSQTQAIDLSQMQFRFIIERGDIQTPNTSVFRVYNLSKQTVNKLKSKEFTSVVMQGGYNDNYGLLFSGTIKYVYNGNDTAVDSFVDIVGADGDEPYNFAVVNSTLAAGSTPADHINVAAQAMATYDVNFDNSINPTFSGNALPRGKVFYGLARDVLRKTAGDCNATWSLQDNNLEFVLKTSYRPGDPIVLTSATGLIGFPQQTQNGIIIRCLLNPAIKMGGRVQIDNNSVQRFRFPLSVSAQAANSLVPSLDADGMYKVLWAQHRGDTRGNDYYTELTCIAVDKTAVGVSTPQIASRLSAGPVPPGPVNPYQGP